MRIGLGQIDMGFEQKEEAMLLCQNLLAQAKEKGVDFVLFPEMTLTGFTMNPKGYGEPITESSSISFFQKEALKNNVAIAFGLPILTETAAENHCIIIDRKGKIIGDYTKIHPFSYGAETEHYASGDTIISCEIDGVPVAPFICYDLRFPEIFQIASQKNLILTVIANWPMARRKHWITLLKARAIECQAFVIGVNRTGLGGGLEYVGDSMIVSPTGEVLSHMVGESGLITVDIHPEDALTYRSSFPLKADRKPALYAKLAQK